MALNLRWLSFSRAARILNTCTTSNLRGSLSISATRDMLDGRPENVAYLLDSDDAVSR